MAPWYMVHHTNCHGRGELPGGCLRALEHLCGVGVVDDSPVHAAEGLAAEHGSADVLFAAAGEGPLDTGAGAWGENGGTLGRIGACAEGDGAAGAGDGRRDELRHCNGHGLLNFGLEIGCDRKSFSFCTEPAR